VRTAPRLKIQGYREKEGAHGWVLYNDVKSGYQFQYASFLKRRFVKGCGG
jgi:hypothetical protein